MTATTPFWREGVGEIDVSMNPVDFILGLMIGAGAAGIAAVFLTRRLLNRHQRTEKRLRQTERLAELGTLTGGLAHEIKNPLTTLKLNLQLLAEDWNDADSDRERHGLHRLNVVRKEADRLGDTLDDFLRYAGRHELDLCLRDMRGVLEEIIDFFAPQARATGVQLRFSPGDDPLPVEIDEDLFKQAVLNLFLNAQQAMGDGGELIVRTRRENAHVRIEIADTGPGIPPKKLDRIFDAFYSTGKAGTGLGLPTAKRIIQEHQGRIEVYSEPGQGTRFLIILPVGTE